MELIEFFVSIEGEGIRQGEVSTFLRFAGCNLNCAYCDTKYANKKNVKIIKLFPEEILEKVKKYSLNKNVTITGGEPLIQKDISSLLDLLNENHFKINIETNGSVDIEPCVKNNLITMDYKLDSSGYRSKMLLENLTKLKKTDVLKFVCKESDFTEIERIIKSFKIKSYIFLSPIFNEIDLEKLVAFQKHLVKKYGLPIRTQIQLHKIIWGPNKRCV